LQAFIRSRRLETIPGQIRAYTVVALLAVLVLLAVLMAAIGNARDGVQTMGHDAGPQVVATGKLYFALSDMDAQVADILLIGREHDLGIGPAGELPKNVIDTYRQATDLMRMELLPRAYNLTLDSGATVRQSYETKRSAMETGRTWIGVTGGLALLVLVVLQIYLAGRFRRLLNPALALATVATLVLAGAGIALMADQRRHLTQAKNAGFDSILALNRARAISHSAFADESRYLLDPGRADTYEQTYLDKVQSVLYVDPGDKPANLKTYYAILPGALRSHDVFIPDAERTLPPPVLLGLFGDEANKTIGPAHSDLGLTLAAYARVIDRDREMRELVAKGDRRGAIELRMGRESGAISTFDDYDTRLTRLIEEHQEEFDQAIKAGDDGLRRWDVLPPAAVLVVAGLILAGVRPRLAEFR
jgi:hypothetical protein